MPELIVRLPLIITNAGWSAVDVNQSVSVNDEMVTDVVLETHPYGPRFWPFSTKLLATLVGVEADVLPTSELANACRLLLVDGGEPVRAMRAALDANMRQSDYGV